MNSSDILTKETISATLRRPDELLREKGIIGEICIIENAPHVITFGLCNSNHDHGAASVTKEPMLLAPLLKDDGRADAFLAATAAYLAQQNRLPRPHWVQATSRTLEKPWFAPKSPNMKAILLLESPAAYRVRNLFVSTNALWRA